MAKKFLLLLLVVLLNIGFILTQQQDQQEDEEEQNQQQQQSSQEEEATAPAPAAPVAQKQQQQQQQQQHGEEATQLAANQGGIRDLRRAPQRAEEPKCGTAELSYQPCTSKSVANKLFLACCEQYVTPECHFMCQYETDHAQSKKLLLQALNSRCTLKSLSGVLYCASQNRDNRQCCQDLDLNSPQLLVGSRCLRMCDPSGTHLGRLEKEDATCLYNWNVIMYCHHSGIREM